MILLVAIGAVMASPQRAPYRAAPTKPVSIRLGPHLRRDQLVVKLVEDAGLSFDKGLLHGPGDLSKLRVELSEATRLFDRPADRIRADAKRADPDGRLADLNLYLRVNGPNAVDIGNRLLGDPRVETAYLSAIPAPPPEDIPPATPDFSTLQGYLNPAPDGFGFDIARSWPGGTGANVTVADLEYSWDHTHEDLSSIANVSTTGWDSGWYPSHGNGVIAMLVGGDNGYGVVGMVPEASLVVGSPYSTPDDYNVASAIDQLTEALDAGDVLLIEQQGLTETAYCPVEIDPAVFDAIALAVAKGIVVVEPSGNGALDLDSPILDGWFDRNVRDSGAIMVGGGASPAGHHPTRTWFLSGSSFGERSDVQGWFDGIVTAASDDYGADWADLFFPDNDPQQAYTTLFGGTSGAAPMVAAVAVVANSVAWQLWEAPWDPIDLRAAMILSGTPQPADDPYHIGPQPDLRRLLRTWAVR